ncbi:hypothetical protein [Microbulbifer sediminum]|uniref:hypothetical protein n=1 Tax=Microbulbifer sediminum TaxID=2904250 RepID=UPI001F1DC78B|nr:hypothetical protein [Microbulbifer sediminum]
MLGEEIYRSVAKSNSGYVASASAELGRAEHLDHSQWWSKIEELKVDSLLLSREAWSGNPQDLASFVLPFWKGRVKIIAFVRPPLEFINSGWWQWGAWSGDGFEKWVEHAANVCDWLTSLKKIQKLFPGTEILVHPLGGNIIDQCLTALGCDPGSVQASRANASLPASILRLFQRHSARLRPSPHRSGIDFVLARHLSLSGAPPWVIPVDIGNSILSRLKQNNEELLKLMSPEERAAVESDNRWWSIDAYLGKEVEPPSPQKPNADELDCLAADLAEALFVANRASG